MTATTATRSYSSSLRQSQAQGTREQIVDAAMQLFSAGEADGFSHEAVARRAGVAARTVYRHFPTRADLMSALWDRLKRETQTEFPTTERELIAETPKAFLKFDRHEALVRAFLAARAGQEVRDLGSAESRAAFQKCLADAMHGMTPKEQARVIAVFQTLYSAPAWQLMRDRAGLSGREASEALRWAFTALLKALRTR